jgi:hypothetical protein
MLLKFENFRGIMKNNFLLHKKWYFWTYPEKCTDQSKALNYLDFIVCKLLQLVLAVSSDAVYTVNLKTSSKVTSLRHTLLHYAGVT